VTHGVADGRLDGRGLPLLGLTADVVEGEQQVVAVPETRRESNLHLLVEVGRPAATHTRVLGYMTTHSKCS